MRCAALLTGILLLFAPPRASCSSRRHASSAAAGRFGDGGAAAATLGVLPASDAAALHAQQLSDALPRVDLVLSHFDEPLSAVASFVARARAELPHSVAAAGVRVFLMTHGACTADGVPVFPAAANATADGDEQQRVPADWRVVCLPNYGKESYAYLRWLEAHRDDASRLVWFSHAVPDDYMTPRLWPRLPLLSRRTGMLGLALVLYASCSGGSDAALGPHLAALHFATTGRFCAASTRYMAFFNGEFIVSAARLRAQPPQLYTALREALELPDGDAMHGDERWREPKSGAPSTRANPLMGYAMERAWSLLWNCTAPHDAALGLCACDEAHPEGCVPHACQCLDA